MSILHGHLDKKTSPVMQSVTTSAKTVFSGGRTMKRKKRRNITGTRGRGAFLKGWSKKQPGYHERTVMMEKCGTKCFLGPRKTFPICNKNTCKRNRKGVYAAYIRAKEYVTIKGSQKYRRISSEARKMLYKNNK